MSDDRAYYQAGQETGGGVMGEIRRQMEEMMTGQRRPTPSIRHQPAGDRTRHGQLLGHGEKTGLAAAAMVGYWMLPLIAGKKRKRKLRRRRARGGPSRAQSAQQPDQPQDSGQDPQS